MTDTVQDGIEHEHAIQNCSTIKKRIENMAQDIEALLDEDPNIQQSNDHDSNET